MPDVCELCGCPIPCGCETPSMTRVALLDEIGRLRDALEKAEAERDEYQRLWHRDAERAKKAEAERDGASLESDERAEKWMAAVEERDRLASALRLREQSQIPVIPHGAQEQMKRLESERDWLKEALREIEQAADAGKASAHISWLAHIALVTGKAPLREGEGE
jgi:hypothetical protein